MKSTYRSLLLASVAMALVAPAFASAPSSSTEVKKPQFEQLAKKGGGKKGGKKKVSLA